MGFQERVSGANVSQLSGAGGSRWLVNDNLEKVLFGIGLWGLSCENQFKTNLGKRMIHRFHLLNWSE